MDVANKQEEPGAVASPRPTFDNSNWRLSIDGTRIVSDSSVPGGPVSSQRDPVDLFDEATWDAIQQEMHGAPEDPSEVSVPRDHSSIPPGVREASEAEIASILPLRSSGGSAPAPSQRSYEPSIVALGTSFNSPWAINDKPEERLMLDADIERSRMLELYKIHAAEHELTEGDTLVFLDYPVPPAKTSLRLDCYGTAYSSRKFRIHSKKLLDTGSSVFEEMLSPTRQFRNLRRRKLVNKLPEGVKYVLDLTPPQEGDELVMQMTELSLTPGIVQWWQADKLHGVESCLVNGHDDICTCMRENHGTSADRTRLPDSEESPEQKRVRLVLEKMNVKDPPKPEKLAFLKNTGEKLDHYTPHFRKIPDYCPFRHCNSIVRLLMFIEGHNITLDSASRVWTMLGIAKIFDCPLVLRDKITQWLMYGANARFVEVLPEEALRMGFALQLSDITQCAFRILVNELALELAAEPGQKVRRESGATIFGRKRGDAGDELENLIQHAARAFCERVESQRQKLELGSVCEKLQIPEWKRMMEMDECLSLIDHEMATAALETLRKLMKVINRDFVVAIRRISHGSQRHHSLAYDSIDNDRATYVQPEDWDDTSTIMETLNRTQWKLCAFFYHDLMYLCQGLFSSQPDDRQPPGSGPPAGELCAQLTSCLEALCEQEADALPQAMIDAHPASRQKLTPVHLETLRMQLDHAIKPIAAWWHRHDIDPPLNITRHLLVTLGPNELKYLPLWAGGNDDGTGGVFEATVPSTDMGPNGPGPSYHTGQTIPSAASSTCGSLMEEIRNMNVRGSTTAGSIDVHDSISTVYRPDHVIADDQSIATESFTTSEGAVYAEARYFEPADHQPMGKAVQMVVDGESIAEDGRSATEGSVSKQPVGQSSSEDWELDDGSDSGSATLSDSSMVML